MPASTEQKLSTAQRRAQLLAMRLAGATWDNIAARLGYASKGAACKDFQRALEQARDTVRRSADELIEIELLRLDRVQAGSWPGAIGGNHQNAEVVLKVHDRRVRLLRLDEDRKGADNAVDAWLGHIAAGDLDDGDAAALAAVA